jgi:hypothetical protein
MHFQPHLLYLTHNFNFYRLAPNHYFNLGLKSVIIWFEHELINSLLPKVDKLYTE